MTYHSILLVLLKIFIDHKCSENSKKNINAFDLLKNVAIADCTHIYDAFKI